MLESTIGGWALSWPSFLSPEESRIAAEEQLVFDPALGQDLLKQAGWVDYDGDPETPLLAANVAGVAQGTPLSLTLLTSPSPFHLVLAEMIRADLGACGVEVQHTSLPESQVYAPGPDGPLFGRDFDLALIAWQPGAKLDCSLYTSEQVPSAENYWIGTNITGFADPGYDAACSSANLALPGETDTALIQAERAYLAGLPAVPLFAPPAITILPSMPCAENAVIDGEDVFSQIEYFDLCE
jgi:peptide/nickel transport system substrate-binding protein